ncbi:hypothetical protein FOVG_15926 [Fusarium oxysporum f. sp. pisi HDV247]|nr:hypothetical protein FOVG_15926 [Fusarium oxysporum f. sp. pisi HDV247]
MTFGYDSKLAFSKSRSGVEAFAQDLLNRLRVVRSSPEARNRPLMFIAHSLGGIVVKKALIMAHNGSAVYGPILKATTGIVFLGTPHRGSDLASWGFLLSNLVSITSIGKNIRKELLRSLSKDSDTLAEISRQFLQRAKSLKIMSFIEQQVESPLTTLVVPEYSAIMGLPNETVLPMNAHHRGLTRFSRKTDQNYILVEAAIREVIYGSLDKYANESNGSFKAAVESATKSSPSTTDSSIPMPSPRLSRSSTTGYPLTFRCKSSAGGLPTLEGLPSTATSKSVLESHIHHRTCNKRPNSSMTNLENQSLSSSNKPVETVTLQISGLRRRLDPESYKERDISHVVKIPGNVEVSRLYSWLEKEVNGIKRVTSFKFKGQKGDIGLKWEDIFTTPVEVTSGQPSYNKQRGLRINTDQSIASFMSKAFPHPITAKLHSSSQQGNSTFNKVSGSVLRVGQDDAPDLVVSFMRTVRVPESDKEYDLPPGLGRFPLFNITPFSHILPLSMVAKGGFFLPMYQMEALWIHFHTEGQKKFAIRPYVGGINGLSGESSEGGMASILRQMNPVTRKQDYIVLPEQLWLDGIATAPGVINQFVATEMAPPQREKSQESRDDGSSKNRDASSDPSIHSDTPEGASIEWQLTGRDEVGGLQLQIIPAFEPDQIHAGSDRNVYMKSRGDISAITPTASIEHVFDVLSTPAELNLKVGQTIHVKDLKAVAQSRPKVVSDLLDEVPLKLTHQSVVELDAVVCHCFEWVFVIKLLGSLKPPISLHFDDEDPFDCILEIVAKELQTSTGCLAIEYSAANHVQGWIPISSWLALTWLPRLTGEGYTRAGRCEFTFIPNRIVKHHRICRVVCDNTVESPYKTLLPVLLAIGEDATVDQLRDVIHNTTGVSTAEYQIQRDSATSPAIDDSERVFTKDDVATSWTGQVPQYLLTQDKRRSISQSSGSSLLPRLSFDPFFNLLPPPYIEFRVHVISSTEAPVKMLCRPSNQVYKIMMAYEDKTGIPMHERYLRFDGGRLQPSSTLSDYDIFMDTALECCPFVVGGGGPSVRLYYNGKEWDELFSNGDSIAELKIILMGKTGIAVREQILRCEGKFVQDNEDLGRYQDNLLTLTAHETTAPTTLGLGAGGKIQQRIERDTNDPRIWDLSSSRIINVQFLDARSFRLVTGHAPPETPITADMYAQMGLSFFKLWSDEQRAVNNISGDWGSVVGVAEAVRRKAKKGKGLSSTDVTTKDEEEWGLLHTGAWSLLKRGGRMMQRAAGDRDFEYPVVVLNVDSTVPDFISIVKEEEN